MSEGKAAGQYITKVINLARTTKVVEGGRIFSYSALVGVGDANGHVGCGRGKAREPAEAIRKGTEQAQRSLLAVLLDGQTLHHTITASHGASTVFMKPAADGTGIIAGGAMRAIFELAGVANVLAKCYGSTNPLNVTRATLKALGSTMTPAHVAAKRGKTVDEILAQRRVRRVRQVVPPPAIPLDEVVHV